MYNSNFAVQKILGVFFFFNYPLQIESNTDRNHIVKLTTNLK